ncbi:MAG: asparagine synthase, partial [Rhodothermales bacterium]|nr:asparagine synthase [Rhodothermales bacterium]
VLTGEAADECYLGYPWLAPNYPKAVRNLPRRILGRLLRQVARPGWTTPNDRELVTGLSSRFEIEMGPAEFPDMPEVTYHAPSTGGLATSGDLSHILRTLLYRNDSMGMAASIEARFPFLDSRLVRMSANLPYDCKIRFSPFVLDPAHPFYRDKWIVREIAARYVPPNLSKREKGMFPTNAFARFKIADQFFENSFVSDWFGLARRRLEYLLSNASPELRLRLTLLEAWAHVCVRDLPKQDLSKKLAQHAHIEPV